MGARVVDVVADGATLKATGENGAERRLGYDHGHLG